MTTLIEIEQHPWQPFIPEGAKVLFLGTFPPGKQRWSMDFYYPNPTNDFWRIMGLIFHNDALALYDGINRKFKLDEIKILLKTQGIALGDTARAVRRLKGNASDKYLEIVEPLPLADILTQMPHCRAIVTTGEKAASVIADLTNTQTPKMGEYVTGSEGIEIWRMPSTSRAYPLAIERKAAYYRTLLEHIGII